MLKWPATTWGHSGIELGLLVEPFKFEKRGKKRARGEKMRLVLSFLPLSHFLRRFQNLEQFQHISVGRLMSMGEKN